ncbi:hypothetical protein C8Q78DRAFT_1075645 [Trametes maxima]|nr:hypothetical protein C8Q78DRAFT_1075645 [Trametes maxima]
MLRFYKDLSEQQALLISGLKAEVAGLHTRVSSLSAQADVYRDALHRLEHVLPVEESNPTTSSDGTAIKVGAAEDRLPVEDLGQPRRVALAFRGAHKTEDKKDISVGSTWPKGKGSATQVDTETIVGLGIEDDQPRSPVKTGVPHRESSSSHVVMGGPALERAVKREWDGGDMIPSMGRKRVRLKPEVVVPQLSRRMRSTYANDTAPRRVHSPLPGPSSSGSDYLGGHLSSRSISPGLVEDIEGPFKTDTEAMHSLYRMDGQSAYAFGTPASPLRTQADNRPSASDGPRRQRQQEVDRDPDTEPPTNEHYVHARLHDVSSLPVTIDPSIRDTKVNREYMSYAFGGSRRVMCVQYNDQNRKEHNHTYKHCLFPKIMINWNVPRKPGEPGVFFLARPKTRWPDGPQKLMVGLDHGQFCYMGEYSFTMTYPMSTQEFKALPNKVRKEWGRNLFKKAKDRELRARLFLHDRLGRTASEQELAEALAADDDYKLEPHKIVEAYDTGFLVMYAWNMECIGYDEEFARAIAARLPAWSKRSNGPKGKCAARAKTATRMTTFEEASKDSGDEDFSDAEI